MEYKEKTGKDYQPGGAKPRSKPEKKDKPKEKVDHGN